MAEQRRVVDDPVIAAIARFLHAARQQADMPRALR